MPYADASSPAARAANARRQARFRKSAKGKAARRTFEKERRRAVALARPFVGVDGEGAGVDELGRQNYVLLRAGEHELWKGGRHLTPKETLGFLADLPPGPIYVGFFFGYDCTQILRDLPPVAVRRLLAPKPPGVHVRSVGWEGFDIEYLRRKHLRVRRRGRKSWVTISDVGTFFQCGFVKALETWGIGDAETRARIQAGKDRRGGDTCTDEDRAYNELECRYLAELMDRFREVADAADCRPAAWEGPGYLASTLLRRHGVPKRKEVPELLRELHRAAVAAYYGGRFELFQYGEIGRAFEADINSAYPFAMLSLPCLLHGRWVRTGVRPKSGLYLAHVTFRKNDRHVCDLPVRTKDHRIVWPRSGSGWYWSPEIEAAERAGTRVRVDDAWAYVPECDCRPFSWVPEVYAERKRQGKSGRGLVLKYGINSLYGKTAQSIGGAPYASPIWAGLITAITRAALIDAYRQLPGDSLVMLATDGVYTRERVPGLREGGELGAWEVHELADLLTVQPGCYFHGRGEAEKVKSRGVNRSVFGPYREAFRKEIRRALRAGRRDLGSVDLPVQTFVGLSLAHHWGRPEAAGMWLKADRTIAFDFASKRAARWKRRGSSAQTFTQAGGAESVPYSRNFGRSENSAKFWDELANAEQPDFLTLLPERA